MLIREITVDDAQRFISLCKKLDEETKFMLYEPGERHIGVEEQRRHIAAVREAGNQTILVAEESDELIGFITALGRPYKRKRHAAHIVVGILQKHAHQGTGTKLFTAMEKWALKHEIHRLELSVMVHNKAAIGLYRKMGFKTEGRMKDSLVVDGRYVDEYLMAKTLDDT
ncbi:MAG: GNAT family N-acetyltransferase [Candidatus Hodarchaeota archaeon]